MRKKFLFVLLAIFSFLIFVVYLIFFSGRVSAGAFDFIDNFDHAAFLTKSGGETASLGHFDGGKELDRLLAERCSRPLPQKLRAEISRHLSFGTTQLAKDLAIINSGKDEAKGSFILSLAFSSSMFKKMSAVKSGDYKIIIRSSGGKAEYSLVLYDTNPVKIEIRYRAKGREKIIDAFSVSGGNDTVKLYIMYLKNNIAVFTETGLWSYFKTPDTGEIGEVKLISLSTGNLPFIKSARINRFTDQEMSAIFSAMTRNRIVPDEDPSKGFSIWNELEYEDKLGGAETRDIHLRRLKLGQETRRAVVFSAGDSFSFKDIRIPRDAVLEFAAAVHPNRFEERKDIKFVIELSKDGSHPDRFVKKYDTKGTRLYQWQDSQWDISKYAGETLDITFRTVVPDDMENPEGALVAWGDPVIRVSAGEDYKNVILISLDTLGTDHLGCYGYARNSSPVIDKWAENATFFSNSISNSSWTLPSHVSILTSLYPGEAGIEVCDNQEHINRSRLAPGIPSLATYLRLAGYNTYAITGGGYVSSIFGFDRGFNVYREDPVRKDFRRDVNEALEFAGRNRNRKFFLFLHTYEIHAPYRRSYFLTDSSMKKDKIIAAYDSGIFYADFHFGRLIQGLKKLGLYEKTVVILTSDHGEIFDHITTEKSNFGSHGHSLSEPLIRVPLIIGGTEEFESGRKIKTLVSGVDITPTVLDFLGLDYKPEAMRGMSLLPLLKNDVFVDRKGYSSNILGGKKDMEALRSAGHKLVSHIDVSTDDEIPEESEFYDLTKDPDEKMNITRHAVKKLFEVELRSLQKDISARRSLLKKFISSRGKYRDLLNALNIGGYVSAISY